ncbi:SRPBCC family protein [Demequina sp. NBRC 110053]|uniref:SRPBCC family protein n=1 Tax=Demequina sp. NBRC 110053 TaxID=1570342 RepID=UPI0009FF2598|nr:SRPBCC family protein [Demequina sp. NBRC 110053]
MATIAVHVKREILAEPAAVWRIITDLDRASTVMTNIVKVERLEGSGYEVGVRWRETRRIFGKEETEEMWVAAVDEPRTTTVAARSGSTSYTTVFRCEPSSLGTTLHVDFAAADSGQGVGKRLAWAVLGRVGMKATEKALVQDLDDIAKAAEARPRR